MKIISQETENQLYILLKKHKKKLMKFPNVVDVMIGYSFKNGQLTEQPCIGVHVSKKTDKKGLSKKDILPETIDGTAVDVLEISPKKHQIEQNSLVNIQGGISITNSKLNQEGTMGSIIYKNGVSYGISNYHVLFSSNDWFSKNGRVSDEIQWITQSGRQTIGTLIFGDKNLDFAVFQLSSNVNPVTVNSINNILGKITGMDVPHSGMQICKSGIATGVTYGVIAQCDNLRMVVTQDNSLQPADTHISDFGDSGSLWINNNNGVLTAIGMHYGGEHDSVELAYGYNLGNTVLAGGYNF